MKYNLKPNKPRAHKPCVNGDARWRETKGHTSIDFNFDTKQAAVVINRLDAHSLLMANRPRYRK